MRLRAVTRLVLCAGLSGAVALGAAPYGMAAKVTKIQKVNALLFRNAPFRVRVGMNVRVLRVKVQLQVSGTRLANLQVRLRPPGGQELIVHDRTGGEGDTLALDVTPGETMSAGPWTLVVDDHTLAAAAGAPGRARLLYYRLDIFYAGNDRGPTLGPGQQPPAPAPEPGSNGQVPQATTPGKGRVPTQAVPGGAAPLVPSKPSPQEAAPAPAPSAFDRPAVDRP